MRGVCGMRCVVCAVLRARERPTERARAVARAGEYKCDYLAVREVRGYFMRNPVVKARYHSLLMHTRLSILHTLSHATRPLSISLHPSSISLEPRATQYLGSSQRHDTHPTHAASLIYHSPSLSLPLPSSHHIYHLEARVLLNKGIILEDAALELRQL